ncbi:hypothetical protein JK159_02200 [Weissella minor]|uniref:hypothetical protein n=1 Tax=Weissella minor TaxID=1620 RepID=UPI001BAE7F2C|nr:hypothetical protein [Weissella minor]MBS0949194.1 hypothetical protein [Weissella minor]
MLYIIIFVLIIVLSILCYLYLQLKQKYNELLETSKMRESVVDNKIIELSNINDSMENNKTLLIRERERIDKMIIDLSNEEASNSQTPLQ